MENIMNPAESQHHQPTKFASDRNPKPCNQVNRYTLPAVQCLAPTPFAIRCWCILVMLTLLYSVPAAATAAAICPQAAVRLEPYAAAAAAAELLLVRWIA
jgi:hypothetical protein